MSLDDALLKDIQSFAQFSYGKNLALYYISFKQRTVKEVKQYLEKHEIDTRYIPDILDNLIAENWLNDQQYVENYLAQNLHSGHKGPYILKQKLMQKGNETKVIEQSKLSSKSLTDKIIQNLMNKGFSYDEAKTAFEKLDTDKDEEQEQELLYQALDKQHRKLSKKYDGYDLKQRLIQHLMRKGFAYDDIQTALRDYLSI